VEERIFQLQARKSELSDAAKAAAPDAQLLSSLLAPLE
jgi:SNF2 family DNA or RNA helicase